MDYTQTLIEKLGSPININNDKSLEYNLRYDKLTDMFEIENYKQNRKPDMKRIPKVKLPLLRNDYVDGKIYMAVLNDGKLVVYDGMHRITALKQIYDESTTQQYHRLSLNILPIYDERFINNKIHELNECKPIPLMNESDNIRLKCSDIALYFTKKYSKMFSSSRNCKVPNEFRDTFTEKIGIIVNTLNFQNDDNNIIIKLFENFNNYVKENLNQVRRKITVKQLDKCKKNNCYIFIMIGWENRLIDYYEQGHITTE